MRETNENARKAKLVAAINNLTRANISEDSLNIDPKIIVLDDRKIKGFPQSTTIIEGE